MQHHYLPALPNADRTRPKGVNARLEGVGELRTHISHSPLPRPPALPGLRKPGCGCRSTRKRRLSVTTTPDSSADWVRIHGEVDLRDCRALGLAARQLVDGDAGTIYVDPGRVTFMGSTLVWFLVQVGNAEGHARRQLVLCRATPMARKVIHLAGMESFASVHPELPEVWPDIAAVVNTATQCGCGSKPNCVSRGSSGSRASSSSLTSATSGWAGGATSSSTPTPPAFR